MSEPVEETVTEDLILGGRVRLRQPREGYRVAIDPVFLAAAAPARSLDRVLDAGMGVGAATFCLLARVPGCRVIGIELQPELAALARENAALNGVEQTVAVLEADLLGAPDLEGAFDVVMANPPYLEAGKATPSPRRAKALADSEGSASLEDWIAFCCRCARPGGHVVVIHRADRLDALIAALRARRCGAMVVFPLWPKPGKPASRVVVRARAGSTGPLTLAPGLVMHDAANRYTPDAQRVLRHAERLPL